MVQFYNKSVAKAGLKLQTVDQVKDWPMGHINQHGSLNDVEGSFDTCLYFYCICTNVNHFNL